MSTFISRSIYQKKKLGFVLSEMNLPNELIQHRVDTTINVVSKLHDNGLCLHEDSHVRD